MKAYTEPTIKLFEFDKEEILTSSGNLNVEEDGENDEPMEWSIIHN